MKKLISVTNMQCGQQYYMLKSNCLSITEVPVEGDNHLKCILALQLYLRDTMRVSREANISTYPQQTN